MKRTALLITAISIAFTTPAIAHQGHELSSGFFHPFTGVDHLAAMLAVGAWGALIGGRAIWALPVSFMGAMLIGAMIAVAGIAVPFVEAMIVISVIALAALLVLRAKPPVWFASSLVALFAVSHGCAHAMEIPPGANILIYGLSFLAATAILHIFGATAGLLLSQRLART